MPTFIFTVSLIFKCYFKITTVVILVVVVVTFIELHPNRNFYIYSKPNFRTNIVIFNNTTNFFVHFSGYVISARDIILISYQVQ